MVRAIDFSVVKCVLVASPGFVRDGFLSRLHSEAARTGNKVLVENQSKFMSVHSSSGYMHSLNEVLVNPAVLARVKDTQAAGEVMALERFHQVMADDGDRAPYGVLHCQRANEVGAIETLLLTDSLFRSVDIATRRRYVALVEDARANGADVKIFSTLHTSGQRLEMMSGVAAILRYPLPGLQHDSDPSSDESED